MPGVDRAAALDLANELAHRLPVVVLPGPKPSIVPTNGIRARLANWFWPTSRASCSRRSNAREGSARASCRRCSAASTVDLLAPRARRAWASILPPVSTLRFRVPGCSQPIGAWLSCALAQVPRLIAALGRRGAGRRRGSALVFVGGNAACAPGAEVSLALPDVALEDLDPRGGRSRPPGASRWEAIVAVCPWQAGSAGRRSSSM